MVPNRRRSTTAGPRALLVVGLALGLAPGLTLADHENSAPPSLSIVAQLSLAPASPRYPGDAVTMLASADPAVPGVAYQFLWDGAIQETTQTLYVYRRPVEPSDDDPSAD